MSNSQDFLPALVCVLVALLFWGMRMRQRTTAVARVRQLDEAAALLVRHARSMDEFLSDRDAPKDLCRLLIAVSDALTDRETVNSWAIWAASRPFDAVIESPETDELFATLSGLHARRPDLFDHFVLGVWTAVTGATLRWPESAVLSERAFSRLVATPKRDVAIAVTVTKFRSKIPYSVKHSTEAAY